LVRAAGREPLERDTLYNIVRGSGVLSDSDRTPDPISPAAC
jgi:hypothetical protein